METIAISGISLDIDEKGMVKVQVVIDGKWRIIFREPFIDGGRTSEMMGARGIAASPISGEEGT